MNAPAGRLRPLVIAVLLTLAVVILTPRSELNGGLGFDGLQYAQMVRDLRDGEQVPVSSLAAYRIVAPALVAYSGLGVVEGFFVLSLIGSAGSLLLLYRLLARRRVPPVLLALALLWWAVLPAGPRYFAYQPVLVDAVGTLLLLALIVAAVERRLLAFALLLPAGALARESLIALVPFLWLCERDRGPVGASLVTAAAAISGVAALAVVRAFSPIPVAPVILLPEAVLQHTGVVVLNVGQHAWRYLAAFPLGLGLLCVLPLVWWRESLVGLFRREPQWVYLGLITAISAVGGGVDHDRYLLPISVPLLVATFTAARAGSLPAAGWVAVTVAHLVAVRFGWPLATDEAGALSYFASTMPFDRLVALAELSLVLIAGGGVLAWLLSRPTMSRQASAP